MRVNVKPLDINSTSEPRSSRKSFSFIRDEYGRLSEEDEREKEVRENERDNGAAVPKSKTLISELTKMKP